MAGFLIPIRDYSSRTLAAVQFAVELHKRTGARQHFLFIRTEPTVSEALLAHSGAHQTTDALSRRIRQTIEDIIDREVKDNGQYLETLNRVGDYFENVCDVAHQKHIDEIIVAVPDVADPNHAKILQEITMLMQMTHCRVLTIHPKKGN